MFLFDISESIFETLGVIFGVGACFVIALQVHKEKTSAKPSSLSMGFLVGWIFIYLFWGLYGLRFNAVALWLTNAIAMVLQIAMFIVVVKKKNKIKIG
jgi:uncharacterized protein with PQ loop repeat